MTSAAETPSALEQRLERLTAQNGAIYHHVLAGNERSLLLAGRQAAWALEQRTDLDDLTGAEFQVFSQWGEDGIIEWLVQRLPIERPLFIEFGVENYREANTRFLLLNRNWKGLVMDGSERYMEEVRREALYWRHDLDAVPAFITRENINDLIGGRGFRGDIGLLSVDIDGNDYWVWEAIDVVSPRIVVCEYNPILGDLHAIAVPYRPDFERFANHYSGLCFGASLAAIIELGRRKGYRFVGTNRNGINAFFVRDDLFEGLRPHLRNLRGYPSLHRDSRDPQRRLSHAAGLERAALIADGTVVEVATGRLLRIGELGGLYSREWLTLMGVS